MDRRIRIAQQTGSARRATAAAERTAEKADETSPAEQLEAIETVLDEWTESESLLSSR